MAYNKGISLKQHEERENAGMLTYWQYDMDKDTLTFVYFAFNYRMFIM